MQINRWLKKPLRANGLLPGSPVCRCTLHRRQRMQMCTCMYVPLYPCVCVCAIVYTCIWVHCPGSTILRIDAWLCLSAFVVPTTVRSYLLTSWCHVRLYDGSRATARGRKVSGVLIGHCERVAPANPVPLRACAPASIMRIYVRSMYVHRLTQ